jgi:hypothetical protein
MIGRVLPETGRVLGIDVGYSKTKRTTAFCCLSWTEDGLDWSFSSATAEPSSREKAFVAVRGRDVPRFLSVAIDGPLRPGLHVRCAYRTAECVLSRGAFQKRGKPGQTHAGSGPELHKHATLLAQMVLQDCPVDRAQLPFSASTGVYEAFPNLFLGVLCDERRYPDRPPKRRRWTDCLFPLVATRLDKLIRSLLPNRRLSRRLTSEEGHEEVAALTCAITALTAAAGQCVAVGARCDGYIVLPPLSYWGVSAKGERWAERELRNIVCHLSCDKVGVQPPEIYSGADLLDLSR